MGSGHRSVGCGHRSIGGVFIRNSSLGPSIDCSLVPSLLKYFPRCNLQKLHPSPLTTHTPHRGLARAAPLLAALGYRRPRFGFGPPLVWSSSLLWASSSLPRALPVFLGLLGCTLSRTGFGRLLKTSMERYRQPEVSVAWDAGPNTRFYLITFP